MSTLPNPWLKPIAGGGDRDIRAERVVLLRHQAATMRRAAEALRGQERKDHLTYADRVADEANAIAALVKTWDESPYEITRT